MSEVKYKMIKDMPLRDEDRVLYRIEAWKDFGDVEKGSLGGWIESYDNLDQDGDCWVYPGAKVYGKARVSGNAKVKENATVHDNATVMGEAVISGDARVFQHATVYGNADVSGFATVYGKAEVFGNVVVYGQARVHDDAWVYGDFTIRGFANVTEKTTQTPIVVDGLEYIVTIMDKHLSIDCQTKTADEWRSITREEAFAMNGKTALRFFKNSTDTLEFLYTKYRANSGN